MIEKLLRDFAAENFGPESNYFPITHGKTQEIKPLVLLVKKRRPFWKRPLKKNTLTTIGRVDTYVTQGKNQEVQDKIDLCVKKEDPELELEMDEDEDVEQANAARNYEVGGEVANTFSGKLQISDELGFLVLGKVDQEYICDAELREILATAELDGDKVAALKGRQLRLITSVVYSSRFQHKGMRMEKLEVDAGMTFPGHPYAHLKGYFKKRVIPPRMAARKTRGPFLMTCCNVVYNEETNRLELPPGVTVGKDVCRDTILDIGDEEYENTAVGLDEGSDLAESFIDEDVKKLEVIKEIVLMPTKDRKERKARVNKYLSWFEEALTKNQKELFPAEVLTDADREFLRSIFVPAPPHKSSVDLSRFPDEKIQGYGIVLKIIADMSDEQWDEIEKAWEESGQ